MMQRLYTVQNRPFHFDEGLLI